MQRKVIKQGNNTLTITLPRAWAKKFSLQAGSDLQVEEQNQRLIISAQHHPEVQQKEIDLSPYGVLIPRAIHALYKKGYDELTIHFSTPGVLPQVQKAMGNETIGYEIVKQSEKYCQIKSISEVMKTEFDSTLRRIFLHLLLIAKDGLHSVGQNDWSALKQLHHLEETNNRLTTFCRRIINKYGYGEARNATFLYVIIEALEKIADEYKYLYTFLLEGKEIKEKSAGKETKLSSPTSALWGAVNEMMEQLYHLFYDFKPEGAVRLAQERKRVVAEGSALLEKSSGKEARVLHHLLIIAQEVFNLLGPLMAMRM